MDIVIGNTSQLSYYFPEDFMKISSRNINYDLYKYQKFGSVYIAFAEQRVFNLSLKEKDFFDINVNLTSKIIDFFSKISEKVIVYGTAELWNNYNGAIDMNMEFNYKYSPYIKSKEELYNVLMQNRSDNKWNNVKIIHPFNFNSLKRKQGFLFYKIFDSIINEKKTNVGCLDINRDLIHPKYLVEISKNTNKDCIVGSGNLINIKDFISDIFSQFGKDYRNYIIEDINEYSQHKGNEFWLNTENKYNDLLKDTLIDIKKIMKENERNKVS